MSWRLFFVLSGIGFAGNNFHYHETLGALSLKYVWLCVRWVEEGGFGQTENGKSVKYTEICRVFAIV